MKVTSLPNRDKEHKKIKDMCDLTALCLYSGVDILKLRQELDLFVAKINTRKNLDSISKDNIEMAAQILTIKPDVMSELLERLII